MVRVNFSTVEGINDYSLVPDGKYMVKVAEVEQDTTQHGFEMWKLRFLIVNGKYHGRFVFDNMVFSDAALKRVKHICSALGLPANMNADLTPDMILDRKCYVAVEAGEYEDKQGNTKQKNVIPFAGYHPVSIPAKVVQKEDIPF